MRDRKEGLMRGREREGVLNEVERVLIVVTKRFVRK